MSHLTQRCARSSAAESENLSCFQCFSARFLTSPSSVFCRVRAHVSLQPRYPNESVRLSGWSRNRAIVALQASTVFAVSETRHEGRHGDSVLPRSSVPLFNDLQPNEVVRVLRL